MARFTADNKLVSFQYLTAAIIAPAVLIDSAAENSIVTSCITESAQHAASDISH